MPSPLVRASIVIDEHSSSDSDDGYLEDEELDADDVAFISASDFVPQPPLAAGMSQRVRRQLVCAGCSFLAIALLLAGLLEILAAEDEAMHGWRRSLCRIVHPDNTSAVGGGRACGRADECMFLPVVPVLAQTIEPNGTTLDAPIKCGVPASITPSLAAGELACDADAADVAYWRARPHHANVECRVPVRLQYALDASACSTPPRPSTPHERLAAYFLWTAPERFVYLERTRAEGDRALHALAAARQEHACVQAALGGAALCALALAAYCWCLPATCTRRKSVSVLEQRRGRARRGGRKDRGKIP